MATNITIRSLLRGSPPVRIGVKELNITTGTVVDLEDPIVRRDLHRNLGSWVITNAGNGDPVSAGASTDPTALAAQTSTGTVTAIDTQTGAAIALVDAPAGGTGATAGAYDTAGHRDTAIALINGLKTDYNKTIEDVTDLYDTVRTMATDYAAVIVDIGSLYTTVSSLVTQLTAVNEALEANGIFSS